MAEITIILNKCTGCTLCKKACPFGAIQIVNRKAVIDMNKCTFCGACVPSCKFAAIEIKKDTCAQVLFSASILFNLYRMRPIV